LAVIESDPLERAVLGSGMGEHGKSPYSTCMSIRSMVCLKGAQNIAI
jgi:hypothetical protein